MQIYHRKIYALLILDLLLVNLIRCTKAPQIPITDLTVKQQLISSLQQDIPGVWAYKDLFKDRRELMLDQGLINRATRYKSNGDRLRKIFDQALQGNDIEMAVIGGSISRGRPFAEKGLGKRVYSKALQDWWGKVIRPLTGSNLIVKDLSIGGVGSEYFANCLPSHLPKESNTNLILWELSGNDIERYGNQNNSSQPLEQFLRNTLQYPSEPAIILLNFFNGREFLSKRGCHDLDSDGELAIAKHYDVTELSWSNSICNYLKSDESGMAFQYLFAKDLLHPGVPAHAQMAFILIDHIRNQFVDSLSKINIASFRKSSNNLPMPLFDQTYTGAPLCFTLLKIDEAEPLNTFHVDIISSPKYYLTTYKAFSNQRDKLQGMETNQPNQLITFRFAVPAYASIVPFKKLTVLSFTKSGEGIAQLDRRARVALRTDRYSPAGSTGIVAARNIGPGHHELKIWSRKGGFLILALMLS